MWAPGAGSAFVTVFSFLSVSLALSAVALVVWVLEFLLLSMAAGFLLKGKLGVDI